MNEEGSKVKMNQEISDSKQVVRVEDVMGTAKKIKKPKDKVNDVPDVYFKLTKAGESLQETPAESRFVWYQEDGIAVLLAHGRGEYYMITSSQAKKLKETLNK